MLNELLKSRIIFVTGKGGVGKSTIVSALGVSSVSEGKRPLLVEFSPDKSIEHIFNIKADVYKEIEINRGLLYFNISSDKALAEYIKRQLILDVISKFVLNTKFYRHFSNTAPGLKELVAIGKLYDLERKRDDNGTYMYDPIIVDAPQLGKFISFIKTPRTVMDMFRIGPVKKEAEKVSGLIFSSKCSVIIVSTPEEMAITEAVEGKRELDKIKRLKLSTIIVNRAISNSIKITDMKYYTDRLKNLINKESISMPVTAALTKLIICTQMEQKSIKTLKNGLEDTPVIILPMLDTMENELFIAEALSSCLLGRNGGIVETPV